MAPAKFPLGRTVITPGALETLHPDDVQAAICRHAAGDWGALDEQDRTENELALREGYRLFSTYYDRSHRRFWIITEADRSSTTVLLPEEY
jgi:hypothetical protein